MKKTIFSHHIEALHTELITLLRFQIAFNRMSQFNDLHQLSRIEWADRIIALKAIENDLVIRLCKLDDTTKGVHSFPKALLEMPSYHPNREQITQNITLFSKAIDSVKRIRRHTQLAHLKIGQEDAEIEPKYQIKGVYELLVNTLDLMAEKELSYKWKDGRHEHYDMKTVLFKKKI